MKGFSMFKYSINLEWSNEDECYISTIQEFPGLSAFGNTPEEAVKEAKIAAKGFIEVLKEDGDKIPEPITKKHFSGQTRLRLPKSLHKELTLEAAKEGVSLNTYIVMLLSERNNTKIIGKMLDNNIEKLLRYNKITHAQTESEPTAIIQKQNWDDNDINILIEKRTLN